MWFIACVASPSDELCTIAENLGIATLQRHLFLCVDASKPKCCDPQASLASWEFLKRRLKELGLVGPQATVFRTKANCLQCCAQGPSQWCIRREPGITTAPPMSLKPLSRST